MRDAKINGPKNRPGLNFCERCGREENTIYEINDVHEVCIDCVNEIKGGSLIELEDAVKAIPLAEWDHDDGNVLWWILPVVEPPYCGSPDDTDWPGYHTHFTRLILPREPKT